MLLGHPRFAIVAILEDMLYKSALRCRNLIHKRPRNILGESLIIFSLDRVDLSI